MTARKLILRLLRMWRDPVRPPRPSSDPELAASRLHATRVLAKADRALEHRRRLDAALDQTIEALRSRHR